MNHVVTCLAQKSVKTSPFPHCSCHNFRLVSSFLFLCLKDLQNGDNKDIRKLMRLEVQEGANSGTSNLVEIKSC